MKTDLTLFITTALLCGCIFATGIVMADCEYEQEDEYIYIVTYIV